MSLVVLLRRGGDLASGVALRLRRSGFRVLISELAQPLAVRRLVSFAEAVYSGRINVEGCIARRVKNPQNTSLVAQIMADGQIPVLINPSVVAAHGRIGDLLESGQIIAEVIGQTVAAPFKGVLRGLIHPGMHVKKGLKSEDVDPRVCALVSDKSLAVAGGVLEAILSSLLAFMPSG